MGPCTKPYICLSMRTIPEAEPGHAGPERADPFQQGIGACEDLHRDRNADVPLSSIKSPNQQLLNALYNAGFLTNEMWQEAREKTETYQERLAYGVNIYAQDDLYLVPMQTLSAFTLASSYAGLYYNQQCLIISTIGNMKNIKTQVFDVLYQYGVITDETVAEAHEKFPDSVVDRVKYYNEVAVQSEMGQMIMAQADAQSEQSVYGLYAGTSPKGTAAKR